MINEANTLLPHDRAADSLKRCWEAISLYCAREVELPNGRRADVLGRVRAGDLYIGEVKTTLKASLIEEALEKYGRYCHYLFVAVPGATEADVARHVPISGFPQPWHRVGIIGVWPGTIGTLRPPSYRQVGRLDAAEITQRLFAAADRKDR